MDPILSAKSTSMADAFTMLLAIQQGPTGPENGRIYKRAMMHNHNPFLQFIFHEKDNISPAKMTPVRWVSVEFRQWDGFFYVYTHTTEQIKQYLPHRKGHVQQGFNYVNFTENSPAKIYSIDEIESATREALGFLIFNQGLTARTVEQSRNVMQKIMQFKNFHARDGKIYMNISDLGKLLEK